MACSLIGTNSARLPFWFQTTKRIWSREVITPSQWYLLGMIMFAVHTFTMALFRLLQTPIVGFGITDQRIGQNTSNFTLQCAPIGCFGEASPTSADLAKSPTMIATSGRTPVGPSKFSTIPAEFHLGPRFFTSPSEVTRGHPRSPKLGESGQIQ